MGLATLAGTVTYIEADGEEKVEVLAGAINFDLRAEYDVQEVGTGTKSINFGSIGTANLILIENLLGDIEVLIDGDVVGHHELVDGTFLLFDCACTALSLKHANDIKAKIIIFGHL
jgi:hypothetical protein